MRFALVLTPTLIACLAMVFIVPHHRRRVDSFRKTTLGGIYGEAFWDRPREMSRRFRLVMLLYLAGMFASFYPVMVVALIRLGMQPEHALSVRIALIAGGMLAAIGAVANLFLIVLSHMNFAWGTATDKDQTPFTWLIPTVQAAVAILSVVVGTSSTCASIAAGAVR